ncbi:DUF3397 domain-containing protein [Alkalibacillus aidingensis]|uniref:DUF3397 domain-containing protein n=1 Tax=Alkalibacillus aidingensis TaxID=2747607 RepID=UPI0016614C86|nr:DUF3397 domain-containing protein [Alkalibacillus aidingensis]
MEMITSILAVLSTLPFLVFIIMFMILKKVTNQATRSTKLAADWSCVLFLVAVIGLVDYIFGLSIWWESIIFYMIFIGIMITRQWRREEEVQFLQAVRFVWRISFVMLTVAYFLLVPIAIYLQF